jgi:hypothetical protein
LVLDAAVLDGPGRSFRRLHDVNAYTRSYQAIALCGFSNKGDIVRMSEASDQAKSATMVSVIDPTFG